jgi:hypothetical protein
VRRLSLLALLPLLAGCGGGSGNGPASARNGVLSGTVTRGPGGACPSQGPCSIPASGVRISFSREGGPSVSATTNASGHYRVTLPAGRYTVSAPQPLKPMHVDVTAGDSRRVDFAVDTKIS